MRHPKVPQKVRKPINASTLEQLYFLRFEVENHFDLAERYLTHPGGAAAQRLMDRRGYRKTLLEKVELSVALDVRRAKVDGVRYQQSKSLERLARILDQLGQGGLELADIQGLADLPEKPRKAYAKLTRRVRKSLALVVIHPDDANTRQGLKLGRRASRLRKTLDELAVGRDDAGHAFSEAASVFTFQTGRLIHLLNDLADALLAANFGPAVRLQNYKQLKNAAHAFSPEAGEFGVERLALTRSGSTIAALKEEHAPGSHVMAVYKEGQAQKVREEISGVDQWQQVYPKVAPKVLSHQVGSDDELGSMVIEHLPGQTLESMLLNSQWQSAGLLMDELLRTLRKIWKNSRTREQAEPGYMNQLRSRMPETRKTHPSLFSQPQRICGLDRPGFDELVDQVDTIESRLRAPFSVLIHGDFNVDNLLYDDLRERVYFIDLHRASYSDYVQDLSVLMVSIYRLPVLDTGPRTQMMALIVQLYEFARRFARRSGDTGFDARLAIALARSFATSTRFIYDRSFARRLAFRSFYLLETVASLTPEKADQFRLSIEEIFSD